MTHIVCIRCEKVKHDRHSHSLTRTCARTYILQRKKTLLLADAMSVRRSLSFVFIFGVATTTCAGVLHQQVQFEILMVRELPNIVVTVEFHCRFSFVSLLLMVLAARGYVLDGKSRASASIVFVIYAVLISGDASKSGSISNCCPFTGDKRRIVHTHTYAQIENTQLISWILH